MSSTFSGSNGGAGDKVTYIVTVDSSGVQQGLSSAQQSFNQFNTSTQSTARNLQSFNQPLQQLGGGLSGVGTNLDSLGQSFGNIDGSLQSTSQNMGALGNNFNAISKNVGGLDNNLGGLSSSVDSVGGSVGDLDKSFGNMDSSLSSTGKNMGALSNNFQDAKGGLTQFNTLQGETIGQTESLSSKISSTGKSFLGLGVGIAATVSSAVGLVRGYQDLQFAHLATERAVRKLSLADEAVTKTSAKVQALIDQGITSGPKYTQAILDQNQAKQQQAIMSQNVEKNQLAENRAHEDFVLGLAPAIVSTVFTATQAFQQLGDKTGLLSKAASGLSRVIGTAGLSGAFLALAPPLTAVIVGLIIGDHAFKNSQKEIAAYTKALGQSVLQLNGFEEARLHVMALFGDKEAQKTLDLLNKQKLAIQQLFDEMNKIGEPKSVAEWTEMAEKDIVGLIEKVKTKSPELAKALADAFNVDVPKQKLDELSKSADTFGRSTQGLSKSVDDVKTHFVSYGDILDENAEKNANNRKEYENLMATFGGGESDLELTNRLVAQNNQTWASWKTVMENVPAILDKTALAFKTLTTNTDGNTKTLSENFKLFQEGKLNTTSLSQGFANLQSQGSSYGSSLKDLKINQTNVNKAMTEADIKTNLLQNELAFGDDIVVKLADDTKTGSAAWNNYVKSIDANITAFQKLNDSWNAFKEASRAKVADALGLDSISDKVDKLIKKFSKGMPKELKVDIKAEIDKKALEQAIGTMIGMAQDQIVGNDELADAFAENLKKKLPHTDAGDAMKKFLQGAIDQSDTGLYLKEHLTQDMQGNWILTIPGEVDEKELTDSATTAAKDMKPVAIPWYLDPKYANTNPVTRGSTSTKGLPKSFTDKFPGTYDKNGKLIRTSFDTPNNNLNNVPDYRSLDPYTENNAQSGTGRSNPSRNSGVPGARTQQIPISAYQYAGIPVDQFDKLARQIVQITKNLNTYAQVIVQVTKNNNLFARTITQISSNFNLFARTIVTVTKDFNLLARSTVQTTKDNNLFARTIAQLVKNNNTYAKTVVTVTKDHNTLAKTIVQVIKDNNVLAKTTVTLTKDNNTYAKTVVQITKDHNTLAKTQVQLTKNNNTLAKTIVQVGKDFKQAASDAKGFASSLNSVASAAKSAASAIRSIPKPPSGVQRFAHGGDFLTQGPELIMVGDNPGGKERVTVRPMSGGASGRYLNSGGIPAQSTTFNGVVNFSISGSDLINERNLQKRIKLTVGENRDKFG